MAAEAVRRLQPFLGVTATCSGDSNLLLRVSAAHNIFHDAGLGVALWAAGARVGTGLTGGAETAGELGHCLDETTLEDLDADGRACVAVHIGNRREREKAEIFRRAALEPPRKWGELDLLYGHPECGRVEGEAGRRNYTELLREEARGSEEVRAYLRDCLLLPLHSAPAGDR